MKHLCGNLFLVCSSFPVYIYHPSELLCITRARTSKLGGRNILTSCETWQNGTMHARGRKNACTDGRNERDPKYACKDPGESHSDYSLTLRQGRLERREPPPKGSDDSATKPVVYVYKC